MAYSGGVGPDISPAVAPVAGTKILLRRSGVKGKLPTAGDAEYGELFINYHSGDPMLCFKDNSDNIVEIKPARAVDGGGGEAPPDTGNTVGDLIWDGTHLFVWDGAAWQAVGPGSLAYVQAADKGTITNTAGDGCDIPLVNNLQAGLMSPGDKNKLDAYPADPTSSLVDLGYTPATDKGTVTNTGGTNAEIPVVGINAGLMTPGDKNKLDTYPDDAAGLRIDLGYTAAADKGTVTNTNGDNAELPLVDSSNAGLMAPGDKGKLDGYPATPDDLAATLDLQAVTDNGNTTTNSVTFGGGNISLNANGSAAFSGDVFVGGNAPGSPNGWLKADGGAEFKGRFLVHRDDDNSAAVLLKNASGDNTHIWYGNGVASFCTNNIVFQANGDSSFDGTLQITQNSSSNIELQQNGTITAVDFKYTGGSAPSPALAGKEINLVKTIELMAAKLAELGGVDIATLFVAEDPVTQPADPADAADA
jgi:hypothetical protein